MKDAWEQGQDVLSKTDFIEFLKSLALEYVSDKSDFENHSVPDFLEAMSAYLTDATPQSLTPTSYDHVDKAAWNAFAQIIYQSCLYE